MDFLSEIINGNNILYISTHVTQGHEFESFWSHTMLYHDIYHMPLLACLWRLIGSRNCVHGTAFGCCSLGLIDPFCHGLALFLRLNSYRAFVCLMYCLLFGRYILQPVALTGDRRREDSPLWGWPTLLPWIEVLGRRGVSTPFHRRQCLY